MPETPFQSGKPFEPEVIRSARTLVRRANTALVLGVAVLVAVTALTVGLAVAGKDSLAMVLALVVLAVALPTIAPPLLYRELHMARQVLQIWGRPAVAVPGTGRDPRWQQARDVVARLRAADADADAMARATELLGVAGRLVYGLTVLREATAVDAGFRAALAAGVPDRADAYAAHVAAAEAKVQTVVDELAALGETPSATR